MSSTSGPVNETETKQAVTMQPSLPMLDILSLPSTSKGDSKEDTSPTVKKLSHTIPVPITAADGTVKYIHVAPVASLPKHRLANAIKLPPNAIKLPPGTIPKHETPKKRLVATNVRPIKLATTVHVGPMESLGTILEAQPVLENQPTPGNEVAITEQSSKNLPIITNCISVANRDDWVHFMSEFSKVREKNNTSKSAVKEKPNSKTITETVAKILDDKPSQAKQPKPKNTFSKKPKNKDKSLQESPHSNNSTKKRFSKERGESLYVANGFKEDVEDLLEKCLQVSKLNFDKFANIWREMDFSCIYHDRQSSAELAELSEEVIHIAKRHLLASNVNFEENVAGLFLVYGLLNLQPYEGFAALRLVPDDVPAMLRLEAEARRQKRHDVLYILGRVLIKGPCQFHVLAREVSAEPALRKYFDGTVQLPNASESVLTRNGECVSQLKDLVSLDMRGRTMREKLRERNGGKDNVSDLCKRPAAQLIDLYKEHTARGSKAAQVTGKFMDVLTKSKSESDRALLLKKIKERAMANVVDPMKHLTSVEERQLTDGSTTDESEIEPVKRTRRKRRVKYYAKGRGRSSATNLRDLFSCDETADEATAPKHSRKEMPTLDTTQGPDNSQDEQKPNNKKISKPKTKSKNTDDKRKGKNNNPRGKKKTANKNVVDFSDPYLDLINIEDLVPPEDTTEVNLNISIDPVTDDEEVLNKTERRDDIETLNSPNANKITSTKIEIEAIGKEVQSKAETDNKPQGKKVSRVPKKEKATTSKNTTNSNTISPKCVRRKTNPKLVPRTKKVDINKKEKDDTPKGSLGEQSESTKTLKSPTKRKTYTAKHSSKKSSLESIQSPTMPTPKGSLGEQSESTKTFKSPTKRKTYTAKHSSKKSSLESIKSPTMPRKDETLSVEKEQKDQLAPKIEKESPRKTDVDPGTPRTEKELPRQNDEESPGTSRAKIDLSNNVEEKSIAKPSPRKRSNTCVDKADAKKCKMDPDLILNTK